MRAPRRSPVNSPALADPELIDALVHALRRPMRRGGHRQPAHLRGYTCTSSRATRIASRDTGRDTLQLGCARCRSAAPARSSSTAWPATACRRLRHRAAARARACCAACRWSPRAAPAPSSTFRDVFETAQRRCRARRQRVPFRVHRHPRSEGEPAGRRNRGAPMNSATGLDTGGPVEDLDFSKGDRTAASHHAARGHRRRTDARLHERRGTCAPRSNEAGWCSSAAARAAVGERRDFRPYT